MRSLVPLFTIALAAAAPALATESISVPAFRSVQLRGGGEVSLDVCDGNCPRNYHLRVDIQSPSAPDVAIAGGGLIRASGGFPAQRQLSAAISGGGKIDMLAVSAGSVNAAVHGGGLISVRARSSLSAAVNGGGEVRYAGNPAVSSAINGGGAVHRLD